ncbi:MAG TPA: hypothetical protein VK550_16365 [Polyangiaceae bacterium]|nr:hypothetical protein [Polyangiaceae bacterium]
MLLALSSGLRFHGLTSRILSSLGVQEIRESSTWPIKGLVVFSGAGFSSNIRSFLISSGRAVDLIDLESWLRLFFGLDLPPGERAKKLPLKTPDNMPSGSNTGTPEQQGEK